MLLASIADSHSAREGCLSFLHRQVNLRGDDTQLMDVRQCDVETTDNKFIIKPFSIPLGLIILSVLSGRFYLMTVFNVGCRERRITI